MCAGGSAGMHGCAADALHVFCGPTRLLQSGYNISTQAPNVGFGAAVKKLIMATATPMGGAAPHRQDNKQPCCRADV